MNFLSDFGLDGLSVVLIGIGMDESKLRQRLDACLLTAAEMAQGPHAWTRYDDPFPAWS